MVSAYAGTRGSGTNPGGNAAKSTGSGGGGGGGNQVEQGGNGGPGIAIFRYQIALLPNIKTQLKQLVVLCLLYLR